MGDHIARGQLTLIIIVALIVLIMVGIIMYAARSTSAKKSEQRVETQQKTTQLLKPVEDYVHQCLDLSARTALEQLGTQGGVLYESQGGNTPDPTLVGTDHVILDGVKVSFGLIKPQGSVGTLFFADPPAYPWPTFPNVYENDTLLVANYTQGYYGINILPQPELVQSLLENVTLANTLACIDWTVFTPQGIEVSPGTPSMRVVLGEQATSFLLQYPVDVTSSAGASTARIDTFGVEVPVRMRRVLEAAHAVVDKDATDITYDPSLVYVGNIQASLARDVGAFTDVFVITDPQSSIGGKQYVFQTARVNRPPALVWVPELDKKLCDTSEIRADGAMLIGDADACASDEFSSFTLLMSSYDPDEDTVNYVFSIRDEATMPPDVYTVKSSDVMFTYIPVIAKVSDGQLSDEQVVTVPVDSKP